MPPTPGARRAGLERDRAYASDPERGSDRRLERRHQPPRTAQPQNTTAQTQTKRAHESDHRRVKPRKPRNLRKQVTVTAREARTGTSALPVPRHTERTVGARPPRLPTHEPRTETPTARRRTDTRRKGTHRRLIALRRRAGERERDATRPHDRRRDRHSGPRCNHRDNNPEHRPPPTNRSFTHDNSHSHLSLLDHDCEQRGHLCAPSHQGASPNLQSTDRVDSCSASSGGRRPDALPAADPSHRRMASSDARAAINAGLDPHAAKHLLVAISVHLDRAIVWSP
jgi:hypothetical protein